MKHQYTGLSLLELRDKYKDLLCPQDWYKDEAFAKEKPPKGIYEIDLGEDLVNLTFEEQKAKLKKGFTPIHPAILVEAIISHYKKTSKRLLETKWVRTESVDSNGNRVDLGYFDSEGVYVSYWGDYRIDNLGLASARKLGRNSKIEPSNLLENRVLNLEKEMESLKSKLANIFENAVNEISKE